jgi:hypothetical protein
VNWILKKYIVRVINGIVTGICLLGAFNIGDPEP